MAKESRFSMATNPKFQNLLCCIMRRFDPISDLDFFDYLCQKIRLLFF